ncbi:hypothetical protein JCM10908_006653 [Rhodotorula pacifica]|uniref:uncharacterized protein n=1 Tax=Rhodotorula pacifica TaxID=1495444 RepID=UPI003180DC30
MNPNNATLSGAAAAAGTPPVQPQPQQPQQAASSAAPSTSKKRNFSALAAAAQGASDGTLPVLGYSPTATAAAAATAPGPAPSVPKKQAKPSKRGKRDDSGNDLWDEELDRVLRHGMTILPNMGRRTIWLEDDEQSYGRNGLIGEYIRRQTGKVRNRTQVASHLAVLRKNNPDDTELHTLVIGHDITPEEFTLINWSQLLGPDLHPQTRETAKQVNDAVKQHRDIVVAAQKARRESGVQGNADGSPAPGAAAGADGAAAPPAAKKAKRAAGGAAGKKQIISPEALEQAMHDILLYGPGNAAPGASGSTNANGAASGSGTGNELELPVPPREYFDAPTVAAVAAAAAAALEQQTQTQHADLHRVLAGLPVTSSSAPSSSSAAPVQFGSLAAVDPSIDPLLQQQVANPPGMSTAPGGSTLALHNVLGGSSTVGPASVSGANSSSNNSIYVNAQDQPSFHQHLQQQISNAMAANAAGNAPARRGPGRPRKSVAPGATTSTTAAAHVPLPADSAAIAAAAAAAVLALPAHQQQAATLASTSTARAAPKKTKHHHHHQHHHQQQQQKEADIQVNGGEDVAMVETERQAEAGGGVGTEASIVGGQHAEEQETPLALHDDEPASTTAATSPSKKGKKHVQNNGGAEARPVADAGEAVDATSGVTKLAGMGPAASTSSSSSKGAKAPSAANATAAATPRRTGSRNATRLAASKPVGDEDDAEEDQLDEEQQQQPAPAPAATTSGKGKTGATTTTAGKGKGKAAAVATATSAPPPPPPAPSSSVPSTATTSKPAGKGRGATSKAKKGKSAAGSQQQDAMQIDEQPTGSTSATSAPGEHAQIVDVHADDGQEEDGDHADKGEHGANPTTPRRRRRKSGEGAHNDDEEGEGEEEGPDGVLMEGEGEYDETGKKWLSGVKKGFMRLVGY